MTRTRIEQWFGANRDDDDNCERRHGLLSRYLDNDLREREATAMAAHLRGCAACRAEFEAMRAQRTILSGGAIPCGSAGARARVLHRFEQEVRAESARVSACPRVSRRLYVPRPLFAAVAAVTLFTMAGGGTLLALRSMRPAPFAVAPVVVRGAPIAAPTPSLPQSEDLKSLFAQHDGSVTISTATPTHAVPRHIAHPVAAAHVAPHHQSRIAANAPRSMDSETTQTVSDEPTPIPSDEIPEAL